MIYKIVIKIYNNLSETEKEYRKKIIDLCKDIVDDFGDDEHEFYDDTTG